MEEEKLKSQVKRIKAKLIQARKADKKFKVFGADSHKYQLNKPISPQQVAAIEQEYGFQLPPCYKTFITQIGNGGSADSHAAGPFYGIYSLQRSIDELADFNGPDGWQRACIIYPFMPEDYWQQQLNVIKNNDLTTEEYDEELARIYGGILLIGSQGCAYINGIILQGEHAGKVVNLSFDHQLPTFTFEVNFLDWYERWLDEVISGKLSDPKSGWFGYSVAGSEKQLLEKYFASECKEYKYYCLEALLLKSTISSKTFKILEKQYQLNNTDLKRISLQVMVNFSYSKASNYLHEYFNIEPEFVIKLLYWYGKKKISEWIEILHTSVPQFKDAEAFRCFVHILEESTTNYCQIILPYTAHADNEIRAIAFYGLDSLNNKTKKTIINHFIAGLTDSDKQVVCAALSALNGIVDSRLLKYYQAIAKKIDEEDKYNDLLYKLNNCLIHFKLTNETILNIDAENYKVKKWFQFWKKS
ncbi:SMI1/KNR4 family protein [Snodgrassella gandavensis]|uniref:SMI1/KNR4 family protein n=1 Tax=Snodgrassella gandavensis TaxID=2946698 RepID=UPI001EF739E9|nr:SMI1/KNR4 family protein [Snodgrassella gandavensis]